MGGKHAMRMELEQSTCDGASRNICCPLSLFCIKRILPCAATYRRKDDEDIYESNKLNSR